MILLKIFFFFFLLASAINANAQGGAAIKASVDKNRILIGEPLQLTVEAVFSSAAKNSFYVRDSIDHFEFLKPPLVDSSSTDKTKMIKVIYTLTSFDSGHWVIPPFVLSPKIKSAAVPVDVVFSEFNPEQEYHDIKDIIEIKPEKKTKNWIWYAAAGTLLTLLVIYFLLRKTKKPPPAVVAAAPDAFEEAMRQLDSLQKQKLTGKDYHTRLVDIFRLYVLQKKNIHSLQKTTDGLVLQLRNTIPDKEMYNQLQQSLRLSDFVKFAKYNPADTDDLFALDTIKKTIQYIEQTP